MNAAINPLNSYRQRATLFPVGQSDQADINDLKLGKAPLRAYANRHQTKPIYPAWANRQPILATAS